LIMSEIAIKTEELTKRYKEITAVDQLNLEVRKGEVLGLLGPNGAGKTTTINMMVGLLKPSSGKVILLNREQFSINEIRNQVGVCPQEIIIWKRLTCLEQLEFMGEMYGLSRKVSRRRSEELIEIMGLSDKKYKLARTLSGGMMRRLNLILALVHDPEILVLDEPEAGLDPQSRVLVRDYIKSLAKNKTVILTTHNMDEAERLSDRVAIIDHGKLLQNDTPDSLKRSIGEGDILEIELNLHDDQSISAAYEMIKKIIPQITQTQNSLILKSRNIVEKIQGITASLEQKNYKIDQIHLRENTLEDVFIHLTGRRLRQ
ncbi:ABC transporter ATP-binding protein, partial [candidate division KSB1 bacterium]